jgi:site-specific recombinase XerC
MEQEGRMASTIGRRLSTLSSFYKYCQTEDILDKNPALNVRRPKVHDESRTLGLDRNELGALLVQAGLGDLRDGASMTLLALNGLRISEALNADIDDLSTERGHHRWRSCARAASTSPSRSRHGLVGHSICTSANAPWGRSSSASKAAGWTATAPIGWSSGS